MALANDTNPTSIKLVLVDESGNSVTKTFYVPTTVWNPATDLWAALQTIRDNLVTAYNAVTDALILRAFVTVSQSDDTSILGAANSEVENIASVVANLETAPKKATLQIPAPAIGIFQGTTGSPKNIVDIADADLLALIAQYQTTGGKFVLSDGETIADTTPLKSGKRIHRKSNKG